MAGNRDCERRVSCSGTKRNASASARIRTSRPGVLRPDPLTIVPRTTYCNNKLGYLDTLTSLMAFSILQHSEIWSINVCRTFDIRFKFPNLLPLLSLSVFYCKETEYCNHSIRSSSSTMTSFICMNINHSLLQTSTAMLIVKVTT